MVDNMTESAAFLCILQAPLSAHYITGGPNGAMATVKRTSAVGTLATHVWGQGIYPN